MLKKIVRNIPKETVSEYVKLAKRINQRVVRLEKAYTQETLLESPEYRALIGTLNSVGVKVDGKPRFPERVATRSDSEVLNLRSAAQLFSERLTKEAFIEPDITDFDTIKQKHTWELNEFRRRLRTAKMLGLDFLSGVKEAERLEKELITGEKRTTRGNIASLLRGEQFTRSITMQGGFDELRRRVRKGLTTVGYSGLFSDIEDENRFVDAVAQYIIDRPKQTTRYYNSQEDYAQVYEVFDRMKREGRLWERENAIYEEIIQKRAQYEKALEKGEISPDTSFDEFYAKF